MQKKLIALAVAGAFAAPAFAATSNVDVYGQLTLSVDYINTDSSLAPEDDKLTRISSNSSRIGFKGSEDLGGGLAGIWQIESQLDMENGINNLTHTFSPASQTNTLAGGNFSTGLRNTFVGLKSATLGTALLGKHDTPYKLATGKLDVFGDTAADYNNVIGNFEGVNAFDLRPGNVVAYITPTFSGIHGAIAYVAGNELGTDASTASGADASAWSAMAMYDNGPIFGSLAYERHNNLNGASTSDNKAWKLGLGYNFGNAKVGFIYEDMELLTGTTNNPGRSAWYLNGAYNMGNIVLKAAYGDMSDVDGNGAAKQGASTYSIGADYNLSKRTMMYALYSKTKNDCGAVGNCGTYGVGAGQGSSFVPDFGSGAGAGANTSGNSGDDPSVFSIGVRHSF